MTVPTTTSAPTTPTVSPLPVPAGSTTPGQTPNQNSGGNVQQLMGSLVNNPSLAPGTQMVATQQQERPGEQQSYTPLGTTSQQATPAPTAPTAQAQAPSVNRIDEQTYLAANPDVAAAVARGEYSSAQQHFDMYGRNENRQGVRQGATTAQAATVGNNTPTMEAAQGQVSQNSLVQAAQGTVDPRSLAVAQQGVATQVRAPAPRTMQEGEQVSGSAVDMNRVDRTLNQIDEQAYLAANPDVAAAIRRGEFSSAQDHYDRFGRFENRQGASQAAQGTVTDDMTVAGQLAKLTANFDASNPPPWAAGVLRGVSQTMAARGISASSMAGQAMVQAALESALPIAQADAAVNERMAQQNLSNRQAMALQKAELRAKFLGQEFDQNFQTRVLNAAKVSEIANMNFTAEQTIALENARLTQNMDIANLNNRQAVALANAATYANMDMANLNNRQQAQVQNAQAFLQMDLSNLNNRQQASVINQQARLQIILSDQAAENAARQLNASNQNQTDQFFANLSTQVSQSNAQQSNFMSQFNADQRNAMERFNTELRNQREQFNATNQLAVDQSNVAWRRQINTANTAAINAANQTNAQNMFNLSSSALNNIWQQFRDEANFAFTASENAASRSHNVAMATLQAQINMDMFDAETRNELGRLVGSTVVDILNRRTTR